MNFLERYTTDPFKDENLDEEEQKEYEALRDMYYYLMAHGEIDESFTSWIKKNKRNLDGILDHAKKVYKGNQFQSYLQKAQL